MQRPEQPAAPAAVALTAPHTPLPRAACQVPPHIGNSRLAVEVLPQRPAAAPDPGSLLGHAARVWPGITARQVLEALRPVSGAAVLEIRWGGGVGADWVCGGQWGLRWGWLGGACVACVCWKRGTVEGNMQPP